MHILLQISLSSRRKDYSNNVGQRTKELFKSYTRGLNAEDLDIHILLLHTFLIYAITGAKTILIM